MAGVTIDLTGLTFGVTLSGGAELDIDQSCLLDFPMPEILVEGDQSWLFTSIQVPVPSIESDGFAGIVGEVDIEVKMPSVLSGGYTSALEGDITFKMPKVFIEGSAGVVGEVDITVPMPFRCIDVEGVALVNGDVDITLPIPVIEAEAYLERLNEVWKSMVVNTSNYSITEYNRWRFNSYANIDGEFFGADSEGIHLLTGTKANGQRIESSFLTGLFDFNSEFLKRVLQTWFVCRSDGELTMVVRVGEESFWEHNLPVTVKALREIRGKVAKGLRERFFAFGAKNRDGSPYTVKSIRVVVEVIRGRIR